jgi:hypothetical protein
MKKLFLFYPAVLAVLFSVSCATPPPADPFYTRLYIGTYDDVWLAALKALNEYPLKLSNKDTGRIQTEIVNGPYNELTMTFPDQLELPERFRYSLDLSFAKLESEDKRPLVRIRIRKLLEKFHDFYTGWIAFPPDGLEEKVLLYRVEHILRMEKMLLKQTPE